MDPTFIDLTGEDPPDPLLEAPLHHVPMLSKAEAAVEVALDATVDTHDHYTDTEQQPGACSEIPEDTSENCNGEDDNDEAAADLDAWDSESVISDIVQSMTPDEKAGSLRGQGSPDDDGNPKKISKKAELVKLLHQLGPHEFIFQLLESDSYTPKGLCEALGGQIELGIDDLPEDHVVYYRVLGKIISRELTKRSKLEKYNTVEDAVELLKNSKNILVLTGAGISTSLGIPDFRSKDGLYNMLQDSPLAEFVDDPQDVFALEIFLENPAIFFTVARSILSPTQKFSPTHSFIRLLQDKGQLLTNYTQNIDNFEACAGIQADKLVHCHGSFATATCIKCKHRVPGSEIEPEISTGQIPRCKACLENIARRRLSAGPSGMKRKRSYNSQAKSSKNRQRQEWEDSTDDSDDDDIDELSDEAAGVMKPDIVFFGEDLPRDFHDRLASRDKALVDLVIVIGTSLMVAPVSEVPGFLPPDVPQIYISREPCRHINFDIQLLGDCDLVVAELCRRAGWELKHHMIPPDEAVDVRTEGGLEFRHRFKREADLKAEIEALEREGARETEGEAVPDASNQIILNEELNHENNDEIKRDDIVGGVVTLE